MTQIVGGGSALKTRLSLVQIVAASAQQRVSARVEADLPLLTSVPYSLPRHTRLVYDKAADSQPLRGRLRQFGVRLICPFKRRTNGTQPKLTKRDRILYSGRWKIERTFAWLDNFRRIVTRWERRAYIHLGFWRLACAFTILRKF